MLLPGYEGVKDILSKSLGSNNPSNVVKATLAGLQQLRSREEIYRGRGIALPAKPSEKPAPAAAPATSAPAAAPASAPAPAPTGDAAAN